MDEGRAATADESRVAAEQAALRRVALLVAQNASAEEVFACVAEEAGAVVGSESTGIFRIVGDTAVTVGRWGVNADEVLPVGMVVPLAGDGAVIRVRDTGEPARVDAYDDVRGTTADVVRPTGLQSTVAAPIVVDGRVWGTLVVGTFEQEPFPEDTEDRLLAFAELASIAIAGADAREQLLESRARLVHAGDAERRRLERNLHDGVQQRLVSLSISLRLARSRFAEDPEQATRLLDDAIANATHAQEELREIARGLHPALLSQRGLNAALRSLVRRGGIPVELDVLEERLPEEIEVATYYVVSEALTNVAKHAQASTVGVSVAQDEGRVVATISDDGVGGVDEARGSGLVGLRDRVEALRGTLTVTSAAGGGTTLRAELPL